MTLDGKARSYVYVPYIEWHAPHPTRIWNPFHSHGRMFPIGCSFIACATVPHSYSSKFYPLWKITSRRNTSKANCLLVDHSDGDSNTLAFSSSQCTAFPLIFAISQTEFLVAPIHMPTHVPQLWRSSVQSTEESSFLITNIEWMLS